MNSQLKSIIDEVSEVSLVRRRGRVDRVTGLVIESKGPSSEVGELCKLIDVNKEIGQAEVVGFRGAVTLLMPLGRLDGIKPGIIVEALGRPLTVGVGACLVGRVLDGLGNPMDDKGPLGLTIQKSVYADPPNAMQRTRIKDSLHTGIRAVDTFLTLGKGQRMGIFAGSGVGKSVTMGMIAKNCRAQINVIVLVGERGREVREFIERDLGPEGLARSVVVVATSDQPALIRLKSSLVGVTIAESFRDEGLDVLLMMDSSTRLAMAQREVGLSVGEPPATKGYPPSVFAFLPPMFERAGTSSKGSITGLYTVLVEGDDMDDPIADTVRSILDGHIVLSRDLAAKNHYPAIDVLASVSRCRTDIIDDDHKKATSELLRSLAVYKKSEDLIRIGAYVKGSDEELDLAVERWPALEGILRQDVDEVYDLRELYATMMNLVGDELGEGSGAGAELSENEESNPEGV
jgi:flagellum-specific ATP synthase